MATVVTESDGTGLPVIRPPGFVGRAQQLAALGAALAGDAAVVLVEGEAGVGKTRLVREFLAAADGQGAGALMAACPPLRTACTLGAVTEALRQARADGIRGLSLSGLAGALRPLFPEWCADLPSAPEPAGDATATRHRLFSALGDLLATLEVGLVVLEDAHWADEATLEFLLFLASRQPPRVSLLVTYRPEDVPASSLLLRLSSVPAGICRTRIQLRPLDVAGTARMVSSMVGGEPVSASFAAFLHERTAGLPLTVEESVRVMAERADLARRDGEWVRRRLDQIAVPPTVRDAVLERAGRLNTAAQRVLRAAAVLASPAAEPVLAAVAGVSAGVARAGLCEALDAGLLAEAGNLVSFRHMLPCQAMYDVIPGPARRALHARAGRALEDVSPVPLAAVARHFREAGERGKWCRYGEQAADVALASGDEAAAATLLHSLVTDGVVLAGDVSRLAGKIPLVLLPEPDRAELAGALRRVLDDRAGGSATEAELRFQLGRLLAGMGDYDGSRQELVRAVPHLSHNRIAAVRAMSMLALPLGSDGTRSEHLRWLRRASRAAMTMGAAERRLVQVNRITALLHLGEEAGWAEAARLPYDAAAAAERVQIARGRLNIGCAAMRWGRYAEAGRQLASCLQLAQTHQYAPIRDMALAARLRLDWCTGAWAENSQTAAGFTGGDALASQARLDALLVSGLLDAAAGQWATAEECLRQVLDETRRHGVADNYVSAAGALARLLLAKGQVDEALSVTATPTLIVARKDTWFWAGDLAPARAGALVRAGLMREAAGFTDAFMRGLSDLAAPLPQAALVQCRAVLAEGQGEQRLAAALFAEASTAWQALPRPYDALLCRERQASCLITAGQGGEGLGLLRDVFRALSTLGARGDAMRVMRTLAAHGVQVRRPWRAGRKGYGDQLSPREREVTQLLIAGHSTREIARSLSRSVKTVDMQLGSAMRKLGVSSRAALAVRAAEAGITTSGPASTGDREAPRPGNPA